MKNTAIVILNYNGRDYLEKFLPSVIQYSGDARIVIADNASTDDSVAWLKSTGWNTELIEITENLGYSGGYNQALEQVDAEYFVLLNSDVEVTENWLVPIIQLMEQHPDVSAVQPKLLSYHEKDTFEYAGAAGGYIDKFGYPFCRGRIFNTFEKDRQQYDNNTSIFWASGACLAIRASDFFNAGKLDPDFFAHMEEIDLCWRLQGYGKKIYYCGESTVYHVGGGTLDKSNPKKTYLNFRNGLSLLFKNLPGKVILYRMIVRAVLDFVAIIRFIFLLQFRHAAAVIHAYIYFLWFIRREMGKRKTVQAHIQVRPHCVVYPGSVVYEYFILGRTRFSSLKNQADLSNTTQN